MAVASCLATAGGRAVILRNTDAALTPFSAVFAMWLRNRSSESNIIPRILASLLGWIISPFISIEEKSDLDTVLVKCVSVVLSPSNMSPLFRSHPIA